MSDERPADAVAKSFQAAGSVDDLLRRLAEEKDLPAADWVALLKNVRRLIPPLEGDRWIYRSVVWFLGLVALSTVIGGFWLTILELSP